ncbi:hypothetical protein Kpho02_62420 [Kitasatospora phosalacinea]|uniref:Uncharacterized protein n=1 Tax=Kitasatospora phosalacinea TaxID=2065 RepID=A0A9W6QF75_9ACTN|nr:hypothetical protein Kpho02_62420 [Kitasatospora phosalacinea]
MRFRVRLALRDLGAHPVRHRERAHGEGHGPDGADQRSGIQRLLLEKAKCCPTRAASAAGSRTVTSRTLAQTEGSIGPGPLGGSGGGAATSVEGAADGVGVGTGARVDAGVGVGDRVGGGAAAGWAVVARERGVGDGGWWEADGVRWGVGCRVVGVEVEAGVGVGVRWAVGVGAGVGLGDGVGAGAGAGVGAGVWQCQGQGGWCGSGGSGGMGGRPSPGARSIARSSDRPRGAR